MSDLFTPAKILMSKLTFSRKFLLISAILFVSTLLLSGPVLIEESASIKEAKLRSVGVDTYGVMVDLLTDIAEHRSETLKANLGIKEGAARLAEIEKSVDLNIQALTSAAKRHSAVGLDLGAWQALEKKWQGLKLASFEEKGAVEWYKKEQGTMGLFDAHTRFIESLNTHLKALSYESGIVATRNRDQVLAVELSGFVVPHLMDRLSQLASAITVMVKDEGFSPDAFLRLTEQVRTIELDSMSASALLQLLNKGERQGVKTAFNSELFTRVERYIQNVNDKIISSNHFNIERGKEYIAGAKGLLEEIEALRLQLITFTASEVEADLRSSQRVMARYITVSGLLILLNIYLLIGFYRGVSSTVHELQITAEALAGGDLAVRIEPSTDDEMADIAYSFNKISEAFDKVVSSVKRSMTQVEGSVTSVSSVATETMSGMADHHQEIDVMVSAMTEMVATAQEVEKNTVEAASATKEADNHTKEGELVVQSAISTIQQLAQEVVRTSGVMKQLAEDANGIGAVTDVIRGIADQTNLLALNAAIEAARAGEQGRGFAVVADEVRTLAQRTRESTDEIQNMINTLQSASEDALGVINASRDSVDESVEKICKTGSALESINVSVERVNCMNEQIASAATEQACTADEITHNMERVRNIAEQASEGASRLVSAAEQLEMLSRDTSDELSRYKVTG